MQNRCNQFRDCVTRMANRRIVFMVVGLAVGFGVARYWPHEPAFAVATDRSGKYSIMTASAGDGMEAVFLLDFLTGNLQGHAINIRNGQFTRSYFRSIVEDFEVSPKNDPQWAIVSGTGKLAGSRGTSWGTSIVYVAELTSGRVIAYGFPYTETQQIQAPAQLEKLNGFVWRESAPD